MFSIDYSKDLNLITLTGNLDSSKSEEARKIFQQAQNSITVDMADLNFICSAGVGVLVMVYNQLKVKGGSVSLINLKPQIKKVFEISLLDSVFNIK